MHGQREKHASDTGNSCGSTRHDACGSCSVLGGAQPRRFRRGRGHVEPDAVLRLEFPPFRRRLGDACRKGVCRIGKHWRPGLAGLVVGHRSAPHDIDDGVVSLALITPFFLVDYMRGALLRR